MDPLNVGGVALVGVFSFSGMLAVFTFLFRIQRGSVTIADDQAKKAVERADHAEQRADKLLAKFDSLRTEMDQVRRDLGSCRAEAANAAVQIQTLRKQLAEYVENNGA